MMMTKHENIEGLKAIFKERIKDDGNQEITEAAVDVVAQLLIDIGRIADAMEMLAKGKS